MPDVKKQLEALAKHREEESHKNLEAIRLQNERAASTKVIYARPVANPSPPENQEYDAYMHISCGDPDDWDKLVLSEDIRNKKCIGCGGTLRAQD